MSGLDYENWKELKEYRDYANIHTIPNPNRKRFQFWKRKRVPNPNLEYTAFKFPPMSVETPKEKQ